LSNDSAISVDVNFPRAFAWKSKISKHSRFGAETILKLDVPICLNSNRQSLLRMRNHYKTSLALALLCLFITEREKMKNVNGLSLVTDASSPEPLDIPLFDIQESDSHYLLAVDLPSLPPLGTSVEVKGDELKVLTGQKSAMNDMIENTILRCRSGHHSGIRAQYRDGVLWIMLPKNPKNRALAAAPSLPK
jgi:HSP20 family molecular chaperone IbpA